MKSYILDDGSELIINNYNTLHASTHQGMDHFYVIRFHDLRNLALMKEVESKWYNYGEYVKSKSGRDILADFFRSCCIGILLKHGVKKNKDIRKKKRTKFDYTLKISYDIKDDKIAESVLKQISVMLDKWIAGAKRYFKDE